MSFSFHRGSGDSRPSQIDSIQPADTPIALIDGANTTRDGTASPTTLVEPNPRAQLASVSSANASSNSINWSPSLQTVLDQPPSTLPYQLIFGGLLFGAAVATWTWFGHINEVGHAKGQLIPKGQVYKIHPVELGKITNLAVKEGQEVKAGQVIAQLDNQVAADEVTRLQQLLIAEQLQLAQMQSLIERTRLEAQTQAAIAKAETQAQAAAIAQAQAQADTNRKLIEQWQSDVVAQNTRRDRLQPLVEEGAIAKEQMFDVEQALRDRQRTITQHQGELQQAIAEAEQLQAGLTQKQAEGRNAQIATQQRVQQLEVEATQRQAKITELQNLLLTAQTKLKDRFLYAPTNGTILSLNVANIGEVVQPGQTIAEMAADNAPLVLTAYLPNKEAGLVKPGMPVQVKLDAFPYQDYGIIPGKVTAISPNAKPDERLGPIYQVEISLSRHSVTTRQQTIPFKPGQTATADIVIRRRRIADLLLDPLRKLQKSGLGL